MGNNHSSAAYNGLKMFRSKSDRPIPPTFLKSVNESQTGSAVVATAVNADSASSVANSEALFWHPRDNDTEREYHSVANSEYVMPSDMKEQNRLEFQHNMVKILFGNDILCPEARRIVKRKGAKVLDVGCAAGAWLDAVFVFNSDAEYHGCDIATDLLDWPVAKCVFGNVLEGLPYEDDTFDYVHQRFLVSAIPKDKWPAVVAELIRVTKSGGWIELVEADVVAHRPSPAYQKVWGAFTAMLTAKGMDVNAGSNLGTIILAGEKVSPSQVSDIKTRTCSLPINWDGKLGHMAGIDIGWAMEGMRPFLPKVIGVEPEEYDALVKTAIEEGKRYKTFGNMSYAYFQVIKE
ncbi:S-adenosyl-L-methionine-dependent methyltransferase [Chytriomyces sp. MP71]|nr:S-adenosyl-L-methionine-dependent methyltransferase [Chytriomyces sp. MP71]